jgi:Protein SET DOMAIN GROUP 2 C-terminal
LESAFLRLLLRVRHPQHLQLQLRCKGLTRQAGGRAHRPLHQFEAAGAGHSAAEPSDAARRYRAGALWAQLALWYKHSSSDVLIGLGVDRRGCMSLPDPDCTSLPAFTSGKYASGGDRATLINLVRRNPAAAWSFSTAWSFRCGRLSTSPLSAPRAHLARR